MDDVFNRTLTDLRGMLQTGVSDLETRVSSGMTDLAQRLSAEAESRARAHDHLHNQTSAKLNALESFFADALDSTNSSLKGFQERTRGDLKTLSDFTEALQAKTDQHAQDTQHSFGALRAETKASLDYLNGDTQKRLDRLTGDLSDLHRSATSLSQRTDQLIREEIAARFSSDVLINQRAQEPDVGRVQVDQRRDGHDEGVHGRSAEGAG